MSEPSVISFVFEGDEWHVQISATPRQVAAALVHLSRELSQAATGDMDEFRRNMDEIERFFTEVMGVKLSPMIVGCEAHPTVQ